MIFYNHPHFIIRSFAGKYPIMKSRSYNNALLFALFGIALGFFGILYEGIVVAPKMLNTSMERIFFWRGFYSVISPIIYYTPINQLATITMIVLYFKTTKQDSVIKKQLGIACIFQLMSFVITFYIVTQLNLKGAFNNPNTDVNEIHSKAIVLNILSVIRIVMVGVALMNVFKAYVRKQLN